MWILLHQRVLLTLSSNIANFYFAKAVDFQNHSSDCWKLSQRNSSKEYHFRVFRVVKMTIIIWEKKRGGKSR